MYEFVVLGAGITGITLIHSLLSKGIDNILALEAEDTPGGLCRTFYIDGHVCDIGGHFFQTKFKDVEDFVFKFFPKEKFYRIDPRISKISIHGRDIDYPLEANVWQLPLELQTEYLISIIQNGESLNKSAPENYEEWIRWKLGNKVCDNYLIPYNNKLWGVGPSELDIDWLHKIPRLEIKEILSNALSHSQDVEKFPAHIRPYYPLSGGYGRVIEAISEPIKNYIKTNCKVSTLTYDGDNKIWIVNNQIKAKKVITTIPWPDLFCALGSPEEIKSQMNHIKYNSIVISLFEIEENLLPYHWRYQPSLDVQHHREFFISNFAKDSKNFGVFTETNFQRFDPHSFSFKGKNLFNYKVNAAYPLPLKGRTKAIQEILKYYQSIDLYGVGRGGEHQHHNHDVCIKNAKELIDKIIQ